ncbi:MAG: hypothetical protein ACR2H3_12865 [Acidimicrobiales bacterium]
MPSSRRRPLVAILGGSLLLAVVWAGLLVPAATAAITGVSPGGATVDPGGSAGADISLNSQDADTTPCLSVNSPHSSIDVSVSRICGPRDTWSSRLTIATAPGTPPGNYTIRINEIDSSTQRRLGSGSFTLTVGGESPPPPPPTSTTVRRTTTTRPAPTTTAPPETTTSSEPVETTTTTEPPAFRPLAAVASLDLPREVLFLPLTGQGFAACIPLTDPCIDPDFELQLVPSADRNITWVPTTASPTGTESASVAAVGRVEVTDPSSVFLVPALDARPAGGRLQLLARRFRTPPGDLVEVADASGGSVSATLSPPVPPVGPPLLASTLFGDPTMVDSSTLVDARPALLVFGPEARVISGIIADPGWNLTTTWLPVVHKDGLAHLARNADGRTGLALPVAARSRAISLRLPAPPESDQRWTWIGLLLLGGAGGIAGLGAWWAVRRR